MKHENEFFHDGNIVTNVQSIFKLGMIRLHLCKIHLISIKWNQAAETFLKHLLLDEVLAWPYHEFKGFSREFPLECPTSSLSCNEGSVKVPTGPELGVIPDPDYIAKHKVL